MTNNDSEIVFDAKSGISEEEQREILAKINNIAEKNRLSISEGGNKDLSFKAKKSGGVFPVAVIIAAAAALAGGMVLLSSMQVKTDAQARTGVKVYNSVERALIEEIRKETLSLLEAAVSQDERSKILEDARAREALLRAGSPQVELERLNMERSQAAAVEAQMGAFFANLNRQIAANNLDEAGGTIKSMRDFINTPAFAALRSIQARKGLYAQAIDSFDTMIEESKQYKAALNSGNSGANPLSDYQAKIAQLEQNLAEKDKTIDALSSQGSGASRRLNDLQKTNSTLQSENRQLARTNNTLQTRNTQLTADLAAQTRSAATLQQSVNTLQQSASALQQNVDQITPRLQQAERDLQAEKLETARLNQTVTARENTINERENTIRARDNTISSNENTIRDLRRQNETQAQRISRIQDIVQGKAAVNMTIGELSESVSKIQEIMSN